jgi:fructose-1,6-bisphosphatase
MGKHIIEQAVGSTADRQFRAILECLPASLHETMTAPGTAAARSQVAHLAGNAR